MFGFQLDRNRYDSGFCIIVEFSRNNILFNCAENQILDFQGGLMRNELFFHEVLPAVQLSYPIFHLIFKTVDGRITIDSIRPCTLIYPPLPSDLDLPVIPISSIVCHRALLYTIVDQVEIDRQLYAFKHDGQNYSIVDLIPEIRATFDQGFHERLPMEVAHLTRFQSPFIIKPLFLVSDTRNPLLFRGYLMPYFVAGSLAELLCRLHQSKHGNADYKNAWVPPRIASRPSSPSESPDLPTVELEPEGSAEAHIASATQADKPCKLLDWATKQLWASDIARGVVLHEANSPSGDIKLDNVVLGADGRICHIDIYPISRGFTLNYGPPELLGLSHVKVTVTHDVFSMGLVLWALSEEFEDFRRGFWQAPRLFCKEGEGAAPEWYRELVNDCLRLDPDKRPSAQAVLNTLVTRSLNH